MIWFTSDLHLGHAKSLCINFGLAQKYGGKTNLRYDDTNPVKEDVEYVDAGASLIDNAADMQYMYLDYLEY